MELKDKLLISSLFVYSILYFLKVKKLKLQSKRIYETLNINDVHDLTGREFEEFCNWILQCNGYKTTLLEEDNDYGRDIIIHMENEDIYIECKRYTPKATKTEDFMIGREICQKLVGSMISNGVYKGIIMTTGNTHKNAIEYIDRLKKNSNLDIQIWGIDKIEKLVNNIK